jgi:hypothetical protein
VELLDNVFSVFAKKITMRTWDEELLELLLDPYRVTIHEHDLIVSFVKCVVTYCLFGWWPVLICSKRKVLPVGGWFTLRENY